MKLRQLLIARQDLFQILALFRYPDNMLIEAGSLWCVIQLSDGQLDTLKQSNFKYNEINL